MTYTSKKNTNTHTTALFMHRFLASLTACLACLMAWACVGSPTLATAQSSGRGWAVLPVQTQDNAQITPATQRAVDTYVRLISRQLTRARHQTWSVKEAKQRFEAVGSVPGVEVTHAIFEEIAALADDAADHLLYGRYPRVQQRLHRIDQLSSEARFRTNDHAQLSAQLFHGCMLAAVVHQEQGHLNEARAVLHRCRQASPIAKPDHLMHAPAIFGLLAEVDANRVLTASNLHVETDPPACALYLNGDYIDKTPVVVEALLPGDYALRVDCPDEHGMHHPGRVHHLRMTDEPTTMRIDDAFDRVIHTDDDAWSLRYANAQQLAVRRHDDALQAAKTIDITDVLLLSVVPSEAYNPDAPLMLRMEHIDARSKAVRAMVYAPMKRPARHVRAILEAVHAERSIDLVHGQALQAPSWYATPQTEPALATAPTLREQRPFPTHWVGGGLLAGAGLVVGLNAIKHIGSGCVAYHMGSCVRTQRTRKAPAALLLTAGSLSVLGGASWMIVGHRRSQRAQRPQLGDTPLEQSTLELRLTPTGMQVQGTF